ncbi:unnamed protein product [Allacma fusca]|uniref:Telomerase reverse transcriptase n=1 Tax=Allacma fusca TaxID=39272 RepID=A0A8J2PWK9_9HEXA|nr:unnamed protein product [Allacma fusca]
MLSLQVSGQFPMPIDDLVEYCQSNVLSEIMLKVVEFHRQTKNLHLILKTILRKWVWKEQKKLSWKNKQNSTGIPCINLSKAYISLNEDSLVEPGTTKKRNAESSCENVGGETFKRARLGSSTIISPATVVSFENLPLSNLIISPSVPTNPSVNIQRRALQFRKLRGKISHNCVLATVSQMLHESGFSLFLENGKVKIYLLAKVASWIFLKYVVVMLRSSFYVTESSSSRNQLVFYLRNTWKSVTDSIHHQLLKSGQMKVVSKDSGQSENATMRFVPKTSNSLRPIVSFHKIHKQKIKTDAGKLLLAYMSSKIAPHGIIDPIHLQNRWQTFLKEWNEKERPTLYFLRSDIRDAYPSVKISKLRAILNSMQIPKFLQEQTYMRLKTGKRCRQKVILSEVTSGRQQTPLYIRNRPWFSFTKSKTTKDFDVLSALESVKSTLSEPVVKIGKHKYTLDLGLPQGWQLSQLLCNIYYGTMDREYFSDYLDVPGELFIRNVDDYFFITMNPQRVARLRHKMENGIKEFGCSINSEKSWNNLLSSLTPLRLHAIVFNSNFNCRPTIWRNVFDGALMMAFRFCAMCRVLYPNIISSFSKDQEVTGLLYAGLVRCAHLMARTAINLRSQAVKESKSLFACEGAVNANCAAQPVDKKRKHSSKLRKETEVVTESELLVVIFHAFILKLSKHGSVFKKILLPRLLYKKNQYSRSIGEAKTNDIFTAVGRNLPPAFEQMKK